MPFIDFNTKKKVRIWEGISGRLAHSTQSTFGLITLEKGAVAAMHQHVHEQWTFVIEGELLFTNDGEEKILTAGMAAFMPSNVPHSASAITECKLIDCFMPVREDFVEMEKNND
jgi:quercetin dioxygenase-like cupin family protein